MDTPRPRPLHRASAALGAPPRDRDQSSSEEEGELPDIPESPASPTYSDITVRRLVSLLIFSLKKMFFIMYIFFICDFL